MKRKSAGRSAALLLTGALGVLFVAALASEAQLVAPGTPPETLAPGQYVWVPELAPSGPVVILVSIAEQRLYAYRNGIRIGYSTVSTGKAGHETPTGVFTVLAKDRDHESNLYQGAKMPFMERLTWSGIALHAGKLPGYPASHGCVRLPLEFSHLLFELDALGTTVVIADDHDGPREAAHPGRILSPDLGTAPPAEAAPVAAAFEWRPERSPQGPVNVLVSAAEETVYVYRNGTEIGRASLRFRTGERSLPEGVFTVLEGFGERESPFAPGRPDHRWMGVPLGSTAREASEEKVELLARIHIPAEFGARVYEMLAPGATIYVTNREVAPHTTTASDFVVMAAQPSETSG